MIAAAAANAVAAAADAVVGWLSLRGCVSAFRVSLHVYAVSECICVCEFVPRHLVAGRNPWLIALSAEEVKLLRNQCHGTVS